MASQSSRSLTLRRTAATAGLALMSLATALAVAPAYAAETGSSATVQLAQGTPPPGAPAPAAPATTAKKTPLYDPLGNVSIPTLVARATLGFMGLSGTAALLFFVYGGFQMITAAGNEKKYASGLNSLKWAVIGLFVIFGSYAILTAIFNALGSAAG